MFEKLLSKKSIKYILIILLISILDNINISLLPHY